MITSSIASQSLLGVFSSSAQANSAVFVKDGAAAKTNDPPIDSGARRTVSSAVNFLRLSLDLRRPTYDTDAQTTWFALLITIQPLHGLDGCIWALP